MSESDDEALSQQTLEEMLRDADYEADDLLIALEEVKRPQEESSNKPVAFRCDDGKTYWLKSSDSMTPHARLSELIAGRLGGLSGLAPRAKVVFAPHESLPEDGSLSYLASYDVGIEDVPGTVNMRDLSAFRTGSFPIDRLDPGSWSQAVVFQTWLGVRDSQVLVDPRGGKIISCDHEHTICQNPDYPLIVIAPPVPGMELRKREAEVQIRAAVYTVQRVPFRDLVEAVAVRSDLVDWGSTVRLRLRIAHALDRRRNELDNKLDEGMKR